MDEFRMSWTTTREKGGWRRTKVLRLQSAVDDSTVGASLLTELDVVGQEAMRVGLVDTELGIVPHLVVARDTGERHSDSDGGEERVGVDRGLSEELEQTAEHFDGLRLGVAR